MTDIEHVAWTGGSVPQSILRVSNAEYRYVTKLYVGHMDEWRAFWQEDSVPDNVHDLFWNRARYDAHATFRHAERQKKEKS